MYHIGLLFMLTAISFGCAAEALHPTKHVVVERPQVECAKLTNLRLAVTGFTPGQNSKIMLLDEAIKDPDNDPCQWLSFVERGRVNTTKDYFRTIYQEIKASYEGYIAPGSRLSISPKRLEEIQTQILRVGKPESLADDIFKINLAELKKVGTINFEENGAIPQAFIPQLGKLWQADAFLYGSYVIADNKIHLSVHLDHVASGKKLLKKSFDRQCSYLPDCKDDMAKLVLNALRNHFPEYSHLLIDAYPNKHADQPKHKHKRDNRIQTVEAKAFGTTRNQAEHLALIQALKKVNPIYLDEYTKLLGSELAQHIIQQRITGYINTYETILVEQVNNGFLVTVHAKISSQQLDQQLRQDCNTLLNIMGHPKFMITIKGEHRFRQEFTHDTEERIKGGLTQAGFQILDFDRWEENKHDFKPFFQIQGDVMITSKPSLLDDGFTTYSGKLSIDVTNPKTSDTLDSFVITTTHNPKSELEFGVIVANDPLTASNQLLSKFAEKAIDQLKRRLKNALFNEYFNNGFPIKLTVNNLQNYDQFKNIVGCLEKIEGITDSDLQTYRKAQLTGSVRYIGKVSELASLIHNTCNISIQDMDLLSIIMTYQPKETFHD
jgi:hypothetical protein